MNPCDCIASISKHFGYYDKVAIDSSQISYTEEKIKPTSDIRSSPYEFEIDTPDNEFICLSDLSLYVKFKVTQKNVLLPLGDDDFVAPANNLISTLWDSINVKVNDCVINAQSSSHIAYKSYNEVILSTDNLNSSALEPRFFAKETQLNNFTVKKFPNNTFIGNDVGFEQKCRKVRDSKSVDIFGVVCCDFFRGNNHLAPGNKLNIIFTRNKDEFVLNTTHWEKSYKLVIEDICLYVKKITLDTNVLPNLIHLNRDQRYLCPYTEIKNFHVPSGISQYQQKIYAKGLIPKQLLISFVSKHAYDGDYRFNPFSYSHAYISRLNLVVNGRMVPVEPLEAHGKVVNRLYYDFLQNIGISNPSRGVDISQENFAKGYTMFAFDLRPDQCNGAHLHPASNGEIDLQVDFSVGTKTEYIVIVHSFFDQIIFIPSNGDRPYSEIF